MAKIAVGDVFEIRTPGGCGYFQITHLHNGPPKMGGLLRVLGEYSEQQMDINKLVAAPTRFKTFFPIEQAVKSGRVRLIGRAPVPDLDAKFPVFRNGVRNPATGAIEVWWLWDGTREWRVGPLTKEMLGMPIREVVNDTLLIERIASGWTPSQCC